MRSVSGVCNRVVLAIFGVFTLLVASWLLASFLGLNLYSPGGQALLARPETTFGELAAAQRPWTPLLGLATCLLAVLLALAVLWEQVPRKARTAPLRLTLEDGSAQATLSPDVLGRALGERALEVPGVVKCSVWVAGSARSSWLQATARVSPDAEVGWAVSELRRRLFQDATTALGGPPQNVDVRLSPHASAASKMLGGGTSTQIPPGPGGSEGETGPAPAGPEGGQSTSQPAAHGAVV